MFFVGEEAGIINGMISLPEDASKHIVQVLRMKVSEKLELTNGAGSVLTAEIIDAHKRNCTVRVVAENSISRSERQVCIAISLLKNASRFEWFLEKATELGVAEIIPLLCARTEKQHFRYDRMKQIVVSAMLQSKQAWLPVLREPTSFSEVIPHSSYTTKLIAHCVDEDKHSITEAWNKSSVQILIGAEGDFTKEEIMLAMQDNYIPVSIGKTRLRSETAGVVAAAVLCL